MFHKKEIMHDGMNVSSGSIFLSRNDHVSTNSYFNSFYESYWTKYTEIRNFYLRIKFRGCLSIRIFRDEPGTGVRLIKVLKKLHHEESDEFIAEIPSAYTSLVKGSAGRIFFDFKAHDASEISDIAICAVEQPIRDVKFSLGICTFSREIYLSETIKSISSCKEISDFLKNIFIVNQGPIFSNQSLIDSISSSNNIKLIEQDNLGGCGGFTRSIKEAVKCDGVVNYHVLMDDDIVIDPRIIRNCAKFLNNTNNEMVLGGSMLDSMRPSMMYEAGARLTKSNVISSLMNNVDVGNCRNLSAFASPEHVDFNAWWFCAIPLSAIREVKYPAPIFIRGDDFEFGVRLAKNGYETVSLPGIAVWHEPFYAKPPGWQQYYDLRNRLIFAACHTDLVKIQRPNQLLRHALIEPLLTHNYQVLNLNLKAIEDFLAGPNTLFSMPSDQKHAEIMSVFGDEKTKTLSRQEAEGFGYLKYGAKSAPKHPMKLAYAAKLLKRLVLRQSKKRPKGILLDADVSSATVGNSSYIMTNGPKSFFLLFSPDKKKFSYYLRRAVRVHSRYKSELPEALDRWKYGISRWRDSATWEDIFARTSAGIISTEQMASEQPAKVQTLEGR